jgi:hypothetical protein
MAKSEATAIAQKRGNWSAPGFPHDGWQCIEIEDVDDSYETCQMCLTSEIRYVHVMKHEAFAAVLRVGVICAGNMEGDLARAGERERQVRNRSIRRKNWLTRTWYSTGMGNQKLKSGANLTVIHPAGARWRARLVNNDDNETVSLGPFATADQAKLAAFDLLFPRIKA